MEDPISRRAALKKYIAALLVGGGGGGMAKAKNNDERKRNVGAGAIAAVVAVAGYETLKSGGHKADFKPTDAEKAKNYVDMLEQEQQKRDERHERE